MSIFWESCFKATDRLLGLMDKNPLSPTYGCFHREYWHQRMCDFPSSSRQQGVLCLSLLWKLEGNFYYRSDELLEFIKGAMIYTCKIQKNDGSFDEWYPNERGWAGPTGYVIYALGRSFEICRDSLDSDTENQVLQCLKKGAGFLSEGWEEHILFNHIAMALLPIYQVYHLTGEDKLLKGFQALFKKFKNYFDSEEGWGIEYDGPDIGYQSATISFLARLHRYQRGDEIREICEQSLNFISYFFYPDHTFARKIGGRQTETLFHYGLVYWCGQGVEIASHLLDWDKESLKNQKQLIPQDHDDHYFIYRMVEFLESGFLESTMGNTVSSFQWILPCKRSPFEKYFSRAGLYVRKEEKSYSVLHLKRGGHLISFCHNGDVIIDSGILGKTKEGRLVTSLEWNDDYQIKMKDKIEVTGDLQFWNQPTFSPLKMIAFRLALMILGKTKTGSYWLKAFIRKILLKGKKQSQLKFKRVITFGDRPSVDSSVLGENSELTLKELYIGGIFDVRYVPQSRYFKSLDLQHPPQRRR